MSKAETKALSLGTRHRWEWFHCGDVLSWNETDLMLLRWVRGTEAARWPFSFAAGLLAVPGTLRLCLTKPRRVNSSSLQTDLKGNRLPVQVCKQGYFKLTGSCLVTESAWEMGVTLVGVQNSKPLCELQNQCWPHGKRLVGRLLVWPVPPTSFCACLIET